MAKQRTYGIAFERRVVQEYLAGAARQPLQRDDGELHEAAEGRGRLSDGVRE